MQQTKITKNILYISILTTVVVLMWIFTSVWSSFTKSTTPPETNKYAQPISPAFDIDAMDELDQRLSVPVNLSEGGDYISDPRQQTPAASDSAEIIENSETDSEAVPLPTDTPEPTL